MLNLIHPEKLFRIAFFFFFCALASCHSSPAVPAGDDGLSAFSKDSLAAHIRILSSDSFQGRRPLTLGEERTVDYLQKAFAGLGLEPGNGNSYLQEVPLVGIGPVGVPSLSVQSPKGNVDLGGADNYVLWTTRPDSVISVDKSNIVFAGFGIVAPEYGWDDYVGLDVKGKTVLVMIGDPGFYDSTLFKGRTTTWYGRSLFKFEEAARHGAAACLIIHNTAAASFPFVALVNTNKGVKLHLDNRHDPNYRLGVQGWITEEAGRKLLAAAGRDSSLIIAARRRGFKALPMGLELSASLRVKEVYNLSHNVIGKITGSKRPDQYIIYSAHWDHLGIGAPNAKGDSIYNGAEDNASGTASLLEIARVFRSIPERPERTIIFLSVTGEEQGLLGSGWYGQHPVYPPARTVADVNIDGMNISGPTKDITWSGMGQSELEDYFRDEVKKKGRYVAPEDHPEAGYYYRSDHFSFAKVGVPSLTVIGGVDNVTGGKAYGKQQQDEYITKYYHQQGDEYDPSRWNLDGGLQDIGLSFLVGRRLAWDTAWPGWKAGSEFRAIREQSSALRR
jgi:Zn-dependent M28 family amino/carboxypeptidase